MIRFSLFNENESYLQGTFCSGITTITGACIVISLTQTTELLRTVGDKSTTNSYAV